MNFFHKIQNFRKISDLFSQIWLKKRHTSLFSFFFFFFLEFGAKSGKKKSSKIRRTSSTACARKKKFAEKNAIFEFFAIEIHWINEFSLIQSQKSRILHFFCEFLMNFFPDFAPNSRKQWRLSFFNQICENKLENCRKFWN